MGKQKYIYSFDKYEGDRRTELKKFGRKIEYRGFDIFQNNNIPNGADGRWEIPKLKYIVPGGVKEGYLTVSIVQAKEGIDKWFMLNERLKSDI
jgi:hypothetical protein